MATNLIVIIVAALVIGLALFIYVFRRTAVIDDKRRQGVFFESAFGPIFYSRRGLKKGPTIILVHGIGASGFSWRKLAPSLEPEFDVINLDLWGFGRSHKDVEAPANLETHALIVLELMASLKVKSSHFIGGSMGGSITLWLGMMHPEVVDRVVTLAPAAHYGLVPGFTKRFGWLAKFTPMMINRTTILNILKRVYALHDAIDDQAIEEYLRPYLDSRTHRTFTNHLELLRDRRVFDGLPNLKIETLTLWGAKDKMVSLSAIEELIPRIPNTIYRVHPTSGHHLMEEDPAWCAKQIVPFLKAEPLPPDTFPAH